MREVGSTGLARSIVASASTYRDEKKSLLRRIAVRMASGFSTRARDARRETVTACPSRRAAHAIRAPRFEAGQLHVGGNASRELAHHAGEHRLDDARHRADRIPRQPSCSSAQEIIATQSASVPSIAPTTTSPRPPPPCLCRPSEHRRLGRLRRRHAGPTTCPPPSRLVPIERGDRPAAPDVNPDQAHIARRRKHHLASPPRSRAP